MRVDNREITTYNKTSFSFSASAKKYSEEGDEEFKYRKYEEAILSYTKGIEVKCEDKELNAKLHTNRAKAHCFLGKIPLPEKIHRSSNLLDCPQSLFFLEIVDVDC